MKFQVLLQDQAVAEWARKYIDYKGLKRLLRAVEETAFVPSIQPSARNETDAPSLIVRPFATSSRPSTPTGDASRADQRLREASVRETVTNVSHQEEIVTLQHILACRPKAEGAFFRALDKELEKIDVFYKQQETYFLGRMDLLKQQVKVLEKERALLSQLAAACHTTPAPQPPLLEPSRDVSNHGAGRRRSSVKQKPHLAQHENGESEENAEENLLTWPKQFTHETMAKLKDFADHLHLGGLLQDHSGHLLAEKTKLFAENRRKLKRAVYEHYRGVGYLKSYKAMNLTGFAKILKKFNKVATWQAADLYMAKVNHAYFAQSTIVETIFTDTEVMPLFLLSPDCF